MFDEDKKHIQHYLFMRFSALNAEEFMRVAKMILKGDPQGERYIQGMVNDIIRELREQDYRDAIGGDDDEDYDDIDLSDLGL